MGTLTYFTTIEDAYYYFFQAKGLSAAQKTAPLEQRYRRAAMLLGWIAVEDAVKAFASKKQLALPSGNSLLLKINFVLEKCHHPLRGWP